MATDNIGESFTSIAKSLRTILSRLQSIQETGEATGVSSDGIIKDNESTDVSNTLTRGFSKLIGKEKKQTGTLTAVERSKYTAIFKILKGVLMPKPEADTLKEVKGAEVVKAEKVQETTEEDEKEGGFLDMLLSIVPALASLGSNVVKTVTNVFSTLTDMLTRLLDVVTTGFTAAAAAAAAAAARAAGGRKPGGGSTRGGGGSTVVADSNKPKDKGQPKQRKGSTVVADSNKPRGRGQPPTKKPPSTPAYQTNYDKIRGFGDNKAADLTKNTPKGKIARIAGRAASVGGKAVKGFTPAGLAVLVASEVANLVIPGPSVEERVGGALGEGLGKLMHGGELKKAAAGFTEEEKADHRRRIAARKQEKQKQLEIDKKLANQQKITDAAVAANAKTFADLNASDRPLSTEQKQTQPVSNNFQVNTELKQINENQLSVLMIIAENISKLVTIQGGRASTAKPPEESFTNNTISPSFESSLSDPAPSPNY